MENKEKLELLTDTLAEAIGYIERLKENKHLVIEPLFQGDYAAVINGIAELVDGLSWLNQVLAGAKEILQFFDKTMEISLSSFNGYLRRVTEALENDDYVMLGDLIEYELDSELNKYAGIFINIQAAVGKETGTKS